jgi:hypothetical protein
MTESAIDIAPACAAQRRPLTYAVTYFAPRSPSPDASLDDKAYAAEHCKQTIPTSVATLDMAGLRSACEAATRQGRKGDAGYIIAGDCATTRKEGGPAGFALIDADDGEPDWSALDQYEGFAWTTHGHTAARPAWRIVIPLLEPMAHGKLRCPFKGAHIRNRTQPAFLPTHAGQGVQWRTLAGVRHLNAAELGGREKTFDGDAEDSLLGALFDAAGWVEGEQVGGLKVRCPWIHDHSDGDPGGTVVFHDDGEGSGLGKFYCSRTRCMAADRKSSAALEALRALPSVQTELAHWSIDGLNGWKRSDGVVAQKSQGTETSLPAVDSTRPPYNMTVPAAAWVGWMNAQFTVMTSLGASGKVRVAYWIDDASNAAAKNPRQSLVLQCKDDFLLKMKPATGFIEGKVNEKGAPMRVEIGPWWLQRFDRGEATRLCFRPDLQPGCRVKGQMNLWRGYGIAPVAGDWSLLREHLRTYVARGDEAHFAYIVGWMAWVVQNPGRRADVVLVFKGTKGSGKNTAFDSLCMMLGQHGKAVSNPRHFTGNFNAHLQDCALLFANEAVPPNDKHTEGVLKALVTDSTIPIERKGVDVEHADNCLSICMASNERWCVPASLDERRFAVYEIDSEGRRDVAYWTALHAQLDNGGRAAMLYDLLEAELGDWHPRSTPPKTDALVEQQIHGLRGADALIQQMLSTGENWGFADGADVKVPDGCVFVGTSVLAEASASKEAFGRRAVDIAKALQRACRDADCAGTRFPVPHQRGKSVRGYVLPPLAEARRRWADSTGLDVDWPDVDGWT